MQSKQILEQSNFPHILELQNECLNLITIKTIEETERGENLHGPFETIEELMEALNAPD